MARVALPIPRRFLIRTDGGTESAAGARIGVCLARAVGASVQPVSVVDPQLIYGAPTPRLLEDRLLAATILAEARAYRPGLLVLRTRAHTGLKRLVLGIVAAMVAARAPCPLLLVPPAARRSRRRRQP